MTPYQDIYNRFLSKISDYSFLKHIEEDSLDDVLYELLRNAIPKFDKCKKDLMNTDDNGFLEELDIYEQDILSGLMVIEWLSPQIYSIENTKQYLGDKDFRFYSQANHLKELISLRKMTENEVHYLMNRYIQREFDYSKFAN